jgi:hypothetical protein
VWRGGLEYALTANLGAGADTLTLDAGQVSSTYVDFGQGTQPDVFVQIGTSHGPVTLLHLP